MENCFCHFNGYAVKDATARKMIEEERNSREKAVEDAKKAAELATIAAAEAAQYAGNVGDIFDVDYTAGGLSFEDGTEENSDQSLAISVRSGYIPVLNGFIGIIVPDGVRFDLYHFNSSLQFIFGEEYMGASPFILQGLEAAYVRIHAYYEDLRELASPAALGDLITVYSQRSDPYAVRYDEQFLTESQKAQARANIGAASIAPTIEIVPTGNLLEDYPINITGTAIGTGGGTISSSSFSCTDFIPVMNKVYATGAFFNFITGAYGMAYYDKDQAYIGGYNFENNNRVENLEIVLPENVKYIRIQVQNAAKVESIVSEKVKEDETFEITENLLSKYPINIQGSIGTGGGLANTDSTYFACSDFIPVLNNVYVSGKFFNFTNGQNGIAFYDENQTYVGGYNFVSNNRVGNLKIELPDNVRYVRVTVVAANVSLIEYIKTEQVKVDPAEYAGNEICVFSKGLCIGDSLTEGTFDSTDENGEGKVRIIPKYSYPAILSKLTGVELTNWGKAGATTKSWYEWKSAEDWTGYDFAIINLGTNDRNLEEGVQATYLQNIIDKLKASNKGIKIFISTILPHYYAWGQVAYGVINDVIKAAVDANDDCYLVDLTTYARCVLGPHKQGHLTAIGYHQEANDYKAIISYIISENLEEFKWVQFIGTDYSYVAT